MEKPHFGLTGLAVMGQNLARNVAHKGFPVVVHNRTLEKTEEFIREHGWPAVDRAGHRTVRVAVRAAHEGDGLVRHA